MSALKITRRAARAAVSESSARPTVKDFDEMDDIAGRMLGMNYKSPVLDSLSKEFRLLEKQERWKQSLAQGPPPDQQNREPEWTYTSSTSNVAKAP
jgi:hypothetical protein